MIYRREIDGLRGIAVLAVIFFHSGLRYNNDFGTFIEGGFLGVDIFFVISGYLITSIILTEKKSDNFTFLDFYNRRIRRILPALFFMMLCSVPVVFFIMEPDQIESFSNSLISVVLFLSNVLFFFEDDYFGSASELKPLLHTWSLAVEEQFYIFFPPFLIALIHLKKYYLMLVFAFLAILSLLLAQLGGNISLTTLSLAPFWSWEDIPGWAFYLAPTRAWELILGVLTAIFLFEKPLKNGIISGLLSAVGLFLIIYSVVFFNDSTPMPGVISLVPTIGAVLIILFANSSNYVGKLLGFKGLVWLGLISYSAYLWHQPIFAFALKISNQRLLTGEIISLIIFILLLGYGSYQFIEKPFRNKSQFTRKQVFTSAFIFSVFFIVVGIIGNKTNGLYELKYHWVSEGNKYLIINNNDLKQERKNFWTNSFKRKLSSDFENNKKTKLLIIGDSHGEDLVYAFNQNNILDNKYQIRFMPIDEICIKHLGSEESYGLLCTKKILQIKNSSLANSSDLILVSNRWTNETIKFVPNLKKWFKQNQNKLMIVGRTAEYLKDVDKVSLSIAKVDLISSINNNNRTLALYFDKKITTINNRVKAVSKNIGTPYLDKVQLICTPSIDNPDSPVSECSFFSEDLKSLYSDYGHWSKAGAIFFGNQLAIKWLPSLDLHLSKLNEQ